MYCIPDKRLHVALALPSCTLFLFVARPTCTDWAIKVNEPV